MIGVDRHFRLTKEVQEADPKLAVVGSGYSWLQAFAFEAGAANVVPGHTTFVGIGRGALAQPDFGRRLLHGEPLDRQTTLPHFQLLHGPDALEAERARPVRDRLPAVRQGGVWADLGRGTARRQSLSRHVRTPTEFGIAGIPHLLNNAPTISMICISALSAGHQRLRLSALGLVSVFVTPWFVGSVG